MKGLTPRGISSETGKDNVSNLKLVVDGRGLGAGLGLGSGLLCGGGLVVDSRG